MAKPLDLIACPVCHADLAPEERSQRCTGCGRLFTDGDVLDLTPVPPPDHEILDRWGLWEQLQANFVAAATAVPEHSLSVTVRPDAEAFADFCAFDGVVLDVGCGTQRLPSYARLDQCRFCGIDPLPGSPERGFEFVQGLGEYLPFRTGSLDQVLFATSLDHMLVPRLALAEARRVVRPGGAVNVWFGEPDRPAPQVNGVRRAVQQARGIPARTLARIQRRPEPAEPEYLARLEQPEGAVDKFHAAYPDADGIAAWFAEVGLELADVSRIEYAHGCFMRGVKQRSNGG